MSPPYPPPPRRLMRDPSKKLIGGVCSGLAKYLNMDVNLVRILAVVITLFTGIPIVLYLIALFVMPEEGATPPQPPYVNGPQPGAYDAGQYGAQQAYGAPAQPPVDQVWGPAGAPWEQPQTAPQTAAATPTPQAWSQPSAPEPTVVVPTSPEATSPEPTSPEPTRAEPTDAEPTSYDTAPATPEQAPTDPESDRKV
jgi:phage shock protein PspC (stress-responsive transcriptional regulator)